MRRCLYSGCRLQAGACLGALALDAVAQVLSSLLDIVSSITGVGCWVWVGGGGGGEGGRGRQWGNRMDSGTQRQRELSAKVTTSGGVQLVAAGDGERGELQYMLPQVAGLALISQ